MNAGTPTGTGRLLNVVHIDPRPDPHPPDEPDPVPPPAPDPDPLPSPGPPEPEPFEGGLATVIPFRRRRPGPSPRQPHLVA